MNTYDRATIAVFVALALLGGALSAQAAGLTRLKGMSQQIHVRKAVELGVVAPSGEYVAVLDQSVPHRDLKASKAQDHNNGWLQFPVGEISDHVTVTGRLFIPADAPHTAAGLRFTVRKHTPRGLLVHADKLLKLEQVDTGQWFEFSIELPIKADADVSAPGSVYLLMSAVPLAGPVYLDDLVVKSSSGADLWAYPSFE